MQRKFLPSLLFLSCSANTASAQIDRSEINGTVTDTSGAVVSGASVALIDAATGAQRIVASGGGGTDVLSSLPVGRFTMTVHKDGFEDVRVADLDLNSGNTPSLRLPKPPKQVYRL